MSHYCHARGCTKMVAPKLFMCVRHWEMLPQRMQRAVWRTYTPGQEVRKDPSKEYLEVTREAIMWLAEYEKRVVRQ